MIRTQIQLTPEQAAALKREAGRRGVSMAALVREAIDTAVRADDSEARWRRASAAVGTFSSEGGNVAAEHDRHLEEAYLS